MKKHFVLSTLSSDQLYTNYVNGANDLPQITTQVLVRGGANIANGAILTPQGVVTPISDEEKLWLETCDAFKEHQKAGWVQISPEKVDPEKFAADMASRDGSAPLVPQDAVEGEKVSSSAGTPKAGKSK